MKPSARFPLTVINESTAYSVYDLRLRIAQFVFDDDNNAELVDFKEAEAGTIGVNATAIVDADVIICPGRMNELRIEIIARNGRTAEVLRLGSDGSLISYVVTDSNNKTLKKDS